MVTVAGSQPAARLQGVPARSAAPSATPAAAPPARPRRLRSPLARAVVPVLGGAAVLGLIFVATWGMAVLIAGGDADSTERLAPTEFELGSVERFAESIATEGPIVLPDLNTTSGERTLVVNHRGDDPTRGWIVYWGFPTGRDATCEVIQVRGTSSFEDCDGRQLDVSELEPAAGVVPIVLDNERLLIDLRPNDEVAAPTTG